MRGAVLFGAIHLVVERDCMDNILGSQMGCDDSSRKPILLLQGIILSLVF